MKRRRNRGLKETIEYDLRKVMDEIEEEDLGEKGVSLFEDAMSDGDTEVENHGEVFVGATGGSNRKLPKIPSFTEQSTRKLPAKPKTKLPRKLPEIPSLKMSRDRANKIDEMLGLLRVDRVPYARFEQNDFAQKIEEAAKIDESLNELSVKDGDFSFLALALDEINELRKRSPKFKGVKRFFLKKFFTDNVEDSVRIIAQQSEEGSRGEKYLQFLMNFVVEAYSDFPGYDEGLEKIMRFLLKQGVKIPDINRVSLEKIFLFESVAINWVCGFEEGYKERNSRAVLDVLRGFWQDDISAKSDARNLDRVFGDLMSVMSVLFNILNREDFLVSLAEFRKEDPNFALSKFISKFVNENYRDDIEMPGIEADVDKIINSGGVMYEALERVSPLDTVTRIKFATNIVERFLKSGKKISGIEDSNKKIFEFIERLISSGFIIRKSRGGYPYESCYDEAKSLLVSMVKAQVGFDKIRDRRAGCKSLFGIVGIGDLGLVNELLDNNVEIPRDILIKAIDKDDLSRKDIEEVDAFLNFFAKERHDHGLLKEILQKGDAEGNNVLHLAIRDGRVDIVKSIFDAVSIMECHDILFEKNHNGDNVLQAALRRGSRDNVCKCVIEYCVKNNADILDEVDNKGRSFLHQIAEVPSTTINRERYNEYNDAQVCLLSDFEPPIAWQR